MSFAFDRATARNIVLYIDESETILTTCWTIPRTGILLSWRVFPQRHELIWLFRADDLEGLNARCLGPRPDNR